MATVPQLPAFSIPDWRRPVAFVTDTAQNLATGLAEQGRETTGEVLTRVGDVVGGAFGGAIRRLTAPALEELLGELEEHDERVRDALREELQTFATAVGDGIFAMAVPDLPGTLRRANSNVGRDYSFDEDIDLADLDNGFDDLDYAAE
jgi:hypothetical protein